MIAAYYTLFRSRPWDTTHTHARSHIHTMYIHLSSLSISLQFPIVFLFIFFLIYRGRFCKVFDFVDLSLHRAHRLWRRYVFYIQRNKCSSLHTNESIYSTQYTPATVRSISYRNLLKIRRHVYSLYMFLACLVNFFLFFICLNTKEREQCIFPRARQLRAQLWNGPSFFFSFMLKKSNIA